MIVLALAFVVGAAGCGSKKNTTTTTTTTAAATTAATTTTSASTSATTTAAASTTPSSTGGLGSLANASNCQALAGLGQAFSSAFTGANGDVQKEADLLKQFADKTPADIKPDFETLADTMEKVAAAMQGVKVGSTPDAATIAKLTQLSSQIDTAKLASAETAIATWAASNCHG